MKIEGTVTGGNKLGREIGFPTANIPVGDTLPVPDGVYAARVEYRGERYSAMAYLGKKPSVSLSGGRVLEVHIFDFAQDIYDRTISVELGAFIRPERRFHSMEELREQLKQDKECISTLPCPTR